jgi:aspartyl/asparaginyl-tRNA synthetase
VTGLRETEILAQFWRPPRRGPKWRWAWMCWRRKATAKSSGGQRIHDMDLLLRRIAEQNLPAEAFDWYIDLRRYGSVPHGGFGMGIERCVAWLCGLEHIRETIAFPRMLYRLKP